MLLLIFNKGGFLYWQEGLSCKLNSTNALRVRISCLLYYSLYSSMVERNTVNILIDVRFILGALAKNINKVC